MRARTAGRYSEFKVNSPKVEVKIAFRGKFEALCAENHLGSTEGIISRKTHSPTASCTEFSLTSEAHEPQKRLRNNFQKTQRTPYTHTHTLHTLTHTHKHTHTTRIQTNIHAHTHNTHNTHTAHTYTHTTRTRTHTNTHAHIHAYRHTDTHAHTHTHANLGKEQVSLFEAAQLADSALQHRQAHEAVVEVLPVGGHGRRAGVTCKMHITRKRVTDPRELLQCKR